MKFFCEKKPIPFFFCYLLLALGASLHAESLTNCPRGTLKEIDFRGLETTKKYVVTRELDAQLESVINCDQLEEDRMRLLSLEIFASVDQKLDSIAEGYRLTYTFKELPAYLIVPSVAQTDQEGWLVGLNLVTLNLAGIDIRSQASWRTNVYPKLNTSTEYYAHAASPWIGDIPLEYLIFINRVESYNSLKLYDERSYRNELSFFYRIKREFSLSLQHFGYYVEHSSDSLAWRTQGHWDVVQGTGLGFRLDLLDNPNSPKNGLWLESDWTPFHLNSNRWIYQLYRVDLRLWKNIGRHIGHTSSLLRYRTGNVGFYERYHLGGVNSLRGYTPEPTRSSQSEWLNTFEYRYQMVPQQSFVLPVLGWNLFWGLETVAGWDLALSWSPHEEERFRHSPFVGMHLLLPGIQRVRFELGMQGFKAEFAFAIGIYEKSITQNYFTR